MTDNSPATDELIAQIEADIKNGTMGEHHVILSLIARICAETAKNSGEDEIIAALLANEPFVFDPATHFVHADDGGAPEHGIKYAPAEQIIHQEDREKLLDLAQAVNDLVHDSLAAELADLVKVTLANGKLYATPAKNSVAPADELRTRAVKFISEHDPFGDVFSQHELSQLEGSNINRVKEANPMSAFEIIPDVYGTMDGDNTRCAVRRGTMGEIADLLYIDTGSRFVRIHEIEPNRFKDTDERMWTVVKDDSKTPLTADFARALPSGAMDDATFSAIEDALDKIDAPMTKDGKWLTLVERIAALAAPANSRKEGEGDHG